MARHSSRGFHLHQKIKSLLLGKRDADFVAWFSHSDSLRGSILGLGVPR